MVSPTLEVKLLCIDAKMPSYGSTFAAGLDISSSVDITVLAKDKALVPTGIALALVNCNPDEYYLRIAPRSGISYKNFLDVGAGVVDVDYRGEVKVLIFNHSDQNFYIKKGDRIAQLIPERREKVKIIQKDAFDETERSEGGFGSTGI